MGFTREGQYRFSDSLLSFRKRAKTACFCLQAAINYSISANVFRASVCATKSSANIHRHTRTTRQAFATRAFNGGECPPLTELTLTQHTMLDSVRNDVCARARRIVNNALQLCVGGGIRGPSKAPDSMRLSPTTPNLRTSQSRRVAMRCVALFLMLGGWGCLQIGCVNWKDGGPVDELSLPTTRMSPDSVGFEITFVRVPLGSRQIGDTLWQSIDEQVLDVEQRRYVNQNGIRAGVVGRQLPPVLLELLENQSNERQLDRAVTSDLDVLSNNRRVQSRAGHRTEIVASTTRPDLAVLYREPGEDKIRGRSFADAQCILVIRAFPQADDTVRMELMPEIHHGLPRKQWVAGQGTFQLLAGREREVFQSMMLDLKLAPGQTLVLSAMPEPTGLGESFFVDNGRGDPQQKLLLVRLAQTQHDGLFDTKIFD